MRKFLSRGKSQFRIIFWNTVLKPLDFFISKTKNNYLIELKTFLLGRKAKLIYLGEGKNWALYWVGKYITQNLKDLNLISAEISYSRFTKNKIIHYASINTLISEEGLRQEHKSNKIVLTWYHIVPHDEKLKFLPLLNKKIDVLVTSSPFTKSKLMELGFREEKIVLIPIGVDLTSFKKFEKSKKESLKKKFNLPKDKIIIGSFQKDGDGWGEGLNPKYAKAPEILCEVLKKIRKVHDVHIFLTGPARGYVKNKLAEYNIPFTHYNFENYLDLVECYNVLDLYIVSSRAEGGPKAILESLATGVPIVTTNVGQVPLIIKHGTNGYVADIDDIDKLSDFSIELIENQDLRNFFIDNGLKSIEKYSWKEVSIQYYNLVCKRFL